MHIDIYTDGGCSGNPGPGGWAFIILEILPKTEKLRFPMGETFDGADKILLERRGAETSTTNNRMEIQAAVEALGALRNELKLKPAKTRVFTDSQYLQKGISDWIHTWKRNGWRNSAREPVKNMDLWSLLDELCNEFTTIEWHWVRGHSGNEYNERCDLMTQDAISSLTV